MRIIIIIIIIFIILSGCIGGNTINGKYLSNNTDTILFTKSNVNGFHAFYATEYMEFTQQTVELTGTYEIMDDELILTYKMFGAVRRFKISNNSHTLIETDIGKMRFDLGE